MKGDFVTEAGLDSTHNHEGTRMRLIKDYRASFEHALYTELIRAAPRLEVEELLDKVRFEPNDDGTCDVFVDFGFDDRGSEFLIGAIHKLPHVRRKYVLSHVVMESGVTVNEVTLTSEHPTPPRLGERTLLLVLRTKEERVNIPGDLEEEYREIAAKHGARYAKLWYYKQVATSAWPMIRKVFRWSLVASIGEWIRRII